MTYIKNLPTGKVLIECKGDDSNLIITTEEIKIERRGGIFSSHQKGEKRIAYTDIKDFQYQRASLLSHGFIYFKIEGSVESLDSLEAATHEYAVTFINFEQDDFEEARKIITDKVNPRKYDNFVEGRNGSLKLTDTGVCILRTGGLFSDFPSGEKNIPYRNITAVQFKKAGLTIGFIQLSVLGGVEAQGGAFNAMTDENSVTYGDPDKTEEFERIKKIIEQRIIEPNIPNQSSYQKENDGLELLEKLAELRDKGIVTEEEFQLKKKQILGL